MKNLIHSKRVRTLTKKEQENIKGGFEFGCFCRIDGEMIDWPQGKTCPDGFPPMC
jgi:hypothetical protein